MSDTIVDSPLVQHYYSRLDAAPDFGCEINSFIDYFNPIPEQFRMLCDALSEGYRIVFSVDLCELLDFAFPTRRSWRLAQRVTEDVRRRRILTDIRFSRQATSAISDQVFHSTLLAGSEIEIVNYLEAAYRNIKNVMKVLGEAEIPVGELDERVKWKFQEERKFDHNFERAFRHKLRHLGVTDRLVHAVSTLISNEGYINHSELRYSAEKRFHYQKQCEQWINRERPQHAGSLNNIVDAFNLALVHSQEPQPQGRIAVVHVTRTPTLHRLRRDVSVRYSIWREVEGVQIPVVCHPQALFLLEEFFPDPTRPGSRSHEVGERFSRYWASTSSALRTFARGCRLNKSGQIDKAIRSLRELAVSYQPEAERFDVFTEVFIEEGEEILHTFGQPIDKKRLDNTIGDLSDQVRELASRMRQSHGLRTYRKMLRLGTAAATDRLTGVEEESPPLVFRATASGEFELEIDERPGIRDFCLVDKAGIVHLGVQRIGKERQRRINIFWPNLMDLHEFQREIAEFFWPTNGIVARILTFDEENFPAIFRSGKSTFIEDVQQKAAESPLRLVRVELGSITLTGEFNVDEEGLCAVEYRKEIPSEVFGLFQRSYGTMPEDYVVDFITQLHDRLER